MGDLTPIVDKFAPLLRLLMLSDHQGEVLAAVGRLKVLLAKAGCDVHDLAERLQQPPGLSESKMQRILDVGIDIGIHRAEEERRRPNAVREVGRDADADRWHEIAVYCQQNPKRRHLYEREPGFIKGMVDRTADALTPSPAQQTWLLNLSPLRRRP